jgi:hypothetical protein
MQQDLERAACEGKQLYATRSLADQILKRPRGHKNPRVLQVYRCPHCRGRHIGKPAR